jgi:hypothetical protein
MSMMNRSLASLGSLSGLGTVAPPAGGLAPGSPCYDPTHDGGIIHCASISNVLLSALNPFSQQMTTTCSDAENACLQTASANTLNQNPTSDLCGNTIGINCSTLIGIGLGLVVLIVVAKSIK